MTGIYTILAPASHAMEVSLILMALGNSDSQPTRASLLKPLGVSR
jgi:hypothetical protein